MFGNGQNAQFNPFQMGQGTGPNGQDPYQLVGQKLGAMFPGGFQNWLSAKMGGTGGWNTQVNPAQPVQPGASGNPNYAASILAKIRGLPIANTPMMGG